MEEKCVNIFKIVLEEADLDHYQFQKLLKNEKELHLRITKVIQELSGDNKYIDEEVTSLLEYFSGYKPKSIMEQINILINFFPNINFNNFEKLIKGKKLPAGAEGWFIIPHWKTIASSYNEAVCKILELIKKSWNNGFLNQCGKLDYLSRSEKTAEILEKINNEQGNKAFMIIPAQLGLRYRGRSPNRAHEIMSPREFGLGAFEVGSMLLTHKERLSHFNDLYIDCSGDVYLFEPEDKFKKAPFFQFVNQQIEFGARWYSYTSPFYGTASAFTF